MTNNNNQNVKKEKKDKSILKVVLTIFIALLLFWCTLSWGINVFKTTMNDDVQTEQVVKYNREVHRLNDITSNAYVGTAVPNNSYVDKVYINTLLTPTDIHSYLNDNLIFIEGTSIGLPFNFYPILAYLHNDSIPYVLGFIKYSSDNIHFGLVDFSTLATIQNFFLGPYLWESFNNPYPIGYNALSNLSGIPIGNQNDILSSIISITPFVSGGSGDMNANPRYDYVYPQYDGELLLYSALDSDIEQNMCLSEILIDTTLTYENYTYTYSSDFYITIGGGIVQYNLDNVYSTQNINDLYYTSYVVANLVYSVDDHGVYINVVYYVNNNTTYNFSDFEDCEVYYDVSYQLGANGVTSTIDTTRTLVQYYSNQSYNNGQNIGYNDGYNIGYEAGKFDETNNKYNYDLGYDVGYDTGYHNGSNDEYARNGFKDIVNVIFNAPYNIFNGFLNFEIFGVNLFNLLSFVFTLCLVGSVISLLLKR